MKAEWYGDLTLFKYLRAVVTFCDVFYMPAVRLNLIFMTLLMLAGLRIKANGEMVMVI